MKKIQLTTLLLLFSFVLFGQKSKVVNVNPDSNGMPWFTDGYTKIPEKELLPIEQVLELRNRSSYSADTKRINSAKLPSAVDNSKLRYMRPAFNQIGGSCGSASRIAYMFAYEINCYRRVAGNLKENMYPSHFTWLLTGQNSDKEDMAQHNGIPNAITYGGSLVSDIYGGRYIGWPDMKEAPDYGWMQGYDKWYQAMHNRIEKTVSFHLKDEKALNLLKEWFLNHWNDSSFPAGGVAGTGCATKGAEYARTTNGKLMVKKWGPQVDHGTTWVGYDDNIAYDFNGDGKITNNIDLNNDGKINFKDWERGALIMRNSWGHSWGNKGNVYVPYRMMDQHNAELYFVRKDYKPRRTMKIKMNYSARSAIKISVGISDNINATRPKKIVECEHFKYAGNGEVPMLGKWADGKMHSEDMEFGYDLTDLTMGYDATKPLKYFLKIQAKSKIEGEGKVKLVSVLNYDNPNKPIETSSTQTDVNIRKGTTYVSVVVEGGKQIATKYLSSKKWKVINFDSQDSQDRKYVRYAIDGNPNTFWHTQWAGVEKPYPHYIAVDMGSEQTVSQFEYLPRQDGNLNGTVSKYELYLSNDGKTWNEPVSRGEWGSNFERVAKFQKTKARYFKFVALSEINGNPWASAAELRFLREKSDTGIENITLNSKNKLNISVVGKKIKIGKLSQQANVYIVDMMGKVMMKSVVSESKNTFTTNLKSGVYVVTVLLKNGEKNSQKVILY